MATSKDKIVEQLKTVKRLEDEIKQYEDEDPCRAYKASLLMFKAKGWLPKPATPCKELINDHQKNFTNCIFSLNPTSIQTHFAGHYLPESHYKRSSCKEVYRHQMQAARCLIGDSLELDQNRVPISVRGLKAWENSQILLFRGMIYSPNPTRRAIQKEGYRLEDPTFLSSDMSRELERSYNLFKRCSLSQNPLFSTLNAPKRESLHQEPLPPVEPPKPWDLD